MRDVYENYSQYLEEARANASRMTTKYSLENAGKIAFQELKKMVKVESNEIKLNVGSGKTIKEGYVNVDKYCEESDVKLDAGDLSDYEDNSVDEVLSEHMLEHVPKNGVVPVLQEWYRVLKSGGVLNLNIPDLE